MVKVPILSGIYATTLPELRTSYPVNMVPVPKASGINDGFLRPADGIVEVAEGPGPDRGGIAWEGVHYRVMGGSFVKVVGDTVTSLGSVPGGAPASFDYGFDYLAVAGGGNLYLYDGTAFTQVTDPDLGRVIDVIWIDGYYMTTDGESLVVTDTNDPFAVNPLKYGSSEANPDPVVALLKLRNEAAALNRHTIEFFDNIGGNLFPFQRIEGAQIQKGCVGTNACCVYEDTIAFLGSGWNEDVSVYLGANGGTVKIATHEIDTILADYSDAELAAAEVEARTDGEHRFLYVHLPDRSLVYDAAASAVLGIPAWHELVSTVTGSAAYQARHFVLADGEWLCGNGAFVGRLDRTTAEHWGEKVRWEIGTIIVYNEGRGAIFHELEMVALTGSIDVGEQAVISSSYSNDGVTWSADRVISAGTTGQRDKRLVWFQQGMMRNWRIQRFRGDSDCRLAPIRLEARLEPLAF